MIAPALRLWTAPALRAWRTLVWIGSQPAIREHFRSLELELDDLEERIPRTQYIPGPPDSGAERAQSRAVIGERCRTIVNINKSRRQHQSAGASNPTQ